MPKNRPDSLPDAASTDLHRVRDILFGEHARDTGERLAALEKRLEDQSATIADLSVELRKQAAAFEKRLGAAIADATTGEGESRDALRDELLNHIHELREQKLDRDALAGLLGGLADRLGKTAKDAR